jgi:hypothetical protein
MKRIVRLTESDLIRLVKRVINEQTEGLDSFLNEIKSKLDLSDELIEEIKSIFEKTECKKVSIENLRGAMGLALHNKLVLSPEIFKNNIPQALTIMFHELAHQYQFKKYGAEKMMEVYIGETSLNDGALAMSQYEAVADEFAIRKMRELKQKGLIDYTPSQVRKGYGNNPQPFMFKSMLEMIRNELKRNGATDIEKAAEYIYNMVKSQ